MKRISQQSHHQPSLLGKISTAVSHIKDVIIEQKDHLVEAVEHKATDIKKAIKKVGNKKKVARKKTTGKKTAMKKTARKAAKKVTRSSSKKSAPRKRKAMAK